MRLYEKTASELSEMLKNKECSAVELCNDVLARINETENKIGAYVTVAEESAKENAKKIDKAMAAGEKLHPLAGIPIGIKDNISTKGIRTTCSSKMLENYVPPFDATVMNKINNAGMTVIGKMNMDEFAMGSSTETSYMHLTRNPYNTECVPGGSSGGSAAAVAAGEAILTLGSDTGGSIRQPAALCGVVGMKPTYGSVSRYGLVAFASSLDQIGPLGKSVKDVAMLQSLICGHDRYDATSKNIEYPDYAAALKENAKGLKIGIPKEYFGEGIDSQVKESVMKAVKEFELQGAVIKEISLPSTEYAINTYYIIASAEASSNLARFDGVKYGYRTSEYDGLVDMYEKTRSEGFGDEVKRRIMLGTFVLSSGYFDAYYKKAKRVQNQISQEFSNAFKECDIIATPTVPASAFKIGENIGDPIKMYYNDVCTVTVNIAGLPAISLPCGKDSAGMPMGLQLIGDKFSEQTLLNTAYTYEKICGGFDVLSKAL
ncbi:Asp-tRNA(Asn)/Glu-tRNA(Gln) amidotransferase subunit GatA [Porcipelethomonas ammoniilytica]|uniref:Asp-tRNA(Asn)/Glu-tRNA(Gln) amidotransferase subunit GatA n=1 Tax=Porcipelethomonas ammoniilytica TaxID=2981722 RepID=UPI00082306E8|nr:Asp-tRNA(Asn)/Glu-tRNA(Gln) amidotransferase subunit GatA [Porcipelethomonas ammoniilytica]MCU6718396.1 Asp-tRNA(Asn)/Glu-tRNA(Gln) amidotransferase subunit GatA [Porcipelethomonas ammoniilytica]SCI50361.1 Glutamyl-tRNA(Gln) amidotransferase subunit A [uncultured Ruminococcus sp.]